MCHAQPLNAAEERATQASLMPGDECQTLTMVSVRQAQALTSELLAQLPKDTICTVLEVGHGARLRVRADTIVGWVSAQTRHGVLLLQKARLAAPAVRSDPSQEEFFPEVFPTRSQNPRHSESTVPAVGAPLTAERASDANLHKCEDSSWWKCFDRDVATDVHKGQELNGGLAVDVTSMDATKRHAAITSLVRTRLAAADASSAAFVLDLLLAQADKLEDLELQVPAAKVAAAGREAVAAQTYKIELAEAQRRAAWVQEQRELHVVATARATEDEEAAESEARHIVEQNGLLEGQVVATGARVRSAVAELRAREETGCEIQSETTNLSEHVEEFHERFQHREKEEAALNSEAEKRRPYALQYYAELDRFHEFEEEQHCAHVELCEEVANLENACAALDAELRATVVAEQNLAELIRIRTQARRQVDKCDCGGTFIVDSLFCRRCGRPRLALGPQGASGVWSDSAAAKQSPSSKLAVSLDILETTPAETLSKERDGISVFPVPRGQVPIASTLPTALTSTSRDGLSLPTREAPIPHARETGATGSISHEGFGREGVFWLAEDGTPNGTVL